MCRQLGRNIILGVDFGKKNCAGVQWTTEHTRVLSIKGLPAIEVEETKLGNTSDGSLSCNSSTPSLHGPESTFWRTI